MGTRIPAGVGGITLTGVTLPCLYCFLVLDLCKVDVLPLLFSMRPAPLLHTAHRYDTARFDFSADPWISGRDSMELVEERNDGLPAVVTHVTRFSLPSTRHNTPSAIINAIIPQSLTTIRTRSYVLLTRHRLSTTFLATYLFPLFQAAR